MQNTNKEASRLYAEWLLDELCFPQQENCLITMINFIKEYFLNITKKTLADILIKTLLVYISVISIGICILSNNI